jgi:hypothetical protein
MTLTSPLGIPHVFRQGMKGGLYLQSLAFRDVPSDGFCAYLASSADVVGAGPELIFPCFSSEGWELFSYDP